MLSICRRKRKKKNRI